MNLVLIFVLLVLAISAIVGYRRGLLRIVYSLVSWIIVLVFVSWATPYVNHYLLENTSIYERVTEHCEEVIRQTADEQVADGQQQAVGELAELGMNLPESVLEGILEKTSDATDTFLEESGIYVQIAEGLANFVIEGMTFLLVLVFAWIVVHLISRLLGIVSHIPIINGANRMLGLVVGVIYGVLLIWLVFYIVALGSTGEMAQVIISYIYENEFLTFLYENNLVLTMIMKYF